VRCFGKKKLDRGESRGSDLLEPNTTIPAPRVYDTETFSPEASIAPRSNLDSKVHFREATTEAQSLSSTSRIKNESQKAKERRSPKSQHGNSLAGSPHLGVGGWKKIKCSRGIRSRKKNLNSILHTKIFQRILGKRAHYTLSPARNKKIRTEGSKAKSTKATTFHKTPRDKKSKARQNKKGCRGKLSACAMNY